MTDKKEIAEDRKSEPAVDKGWSTFTCMSEGCMTTERASEMFNIACNPLTLKGVNDLRKYVRCTACATNIAQSNGRRLGEPGCGVYFLSVTLRDMARKEDDPVPPGVTAYACTHADCKIARRSLDMYNIGIGHKPADIKEILPTIVCRVHAEEKAAENGLLPCDPGSNVYRLSFTLRIIQEQSGPQLPADRPSRPADRPSRPADRPSRPR